MNPTLDRLSIAFTENDARSVIRTIFQASTDEALAAAWRRTDGEAGDPIADLLAFELGRRDADF